MSRPIFSAPGKIVVAGEYAVLEGFESLSVSLDRRVSVVTQPTASSSIHAQKGVVGCVAEELLARGFEIPKVDLAIDSSSLYLASNPSIKLGLGSSSAVAVAVTAALVDELGIDFKSQVCFDIAQGAHQRFTQNRGSGIDIATSFYGGAIRFRRVNQGAPLIVPCDLSIEPSSLIVVYTGVNQSTSVYLKRLMTGQDRDRSGYNEAIFGIGSAAQRIIACLTSKSPSITNWEELIEAVCEHNLWMRHLGKVCNMDILGDLHSQISTIAEKHEGIAKPSGAGGGDITLCFIKPGKQREFLRELKDNTFLALEANFCVPGVASQLP